MSNKIRYKHGLYSRTSNVLNVWSDYDYIILPKGFDVDYVRWGRIVKHFEELGDTPFVELSNSSYKIFASIPLKVLDKEEETR